MTVPLEYPSSHLIIGRVAEIRESSASMIPTCLAPRNFSKDFLASGSLPLDNNQAGDSGQNKTITKHRIGMIIVDPMAYLQANTAPENQNQLYHLFIHPKYFS